MSTTLEAVLTSIEDALVGMTPTNQPRKPFVNDGTDAATLENEPSNEDRLRRFEVAFGKGERGDVAVGPGEEEWVQPFIVTVVYPKSENLRADELLIRQDADDMERMFSDGNSWAAEVLYQDVLPIEPPVLHETTATWFLTVTVLTRFMKSSAPGGLPVPPESGNAALATIGPAAGVGAVITGQAMYEGGGWVTFTTGAGPAAGVLFTVTLPGPLQLNAVVPGDGNATAAQANLAADCYVEASAVAVSSYDVHFLDDGPGIVEGQSYTLVLTATH